MSDALRTPTRILAIETATEACSIALFEGGKLIAHDHRSIGRGHAEMLVPMIAGLPEKGRADRILVSLGPGSFTGVRIGIASARALGVAWNSEVLGYPTLALIAAMAQAESDEAVSVCMTGGHGEWFVQDFAPGAVAQGPMASLTPAAAAKRSVHERIAGTKAADLAALHDRAGYEARTLLPDARNVMALAERHFARDLTPIYGRPPDAKPQAAITASFPA